MSDYHSMGDYFTVVIDDRRIYFEASLPKSEAYTANGRMLHYYDLAITEVDLHINEATTSRIDEWYDGRIMLWKSTKRTLQFYDTIMHTYTDYDDFVSHDDMVSSRIQYRDSIYGDISSDALVKQILYEFFFP